MSGPPAWRSAWWPWIVVGGVLALTLVLGAIEAREPATATEQVADIANAIRCPTCSGESVAQSDADISKQIRLDIAQRLQSGQTPEQIRSYYASRYGETILLTPQSSGLVGLIWVLPVAALVVALSGLVIVFRRWSATPAVHASADDRALVEHALAGDRVGDSAEERSDGGGRGGSGGGADG